ncbi:OsmC family protein [Niveomyces insectorum RCEF 264]|uniref:OsmC family protein n=1 Tax=Niveomyces insectorum RCEF 264 TaxID=1081102 RepID=A0A167YPZ1_9HYPO|nr:OsmC family protein [Niveomyces insectorum RCEF 264]
MSSTPAFMLLRRGATASFRRTCLNGRSFSSSAAAFQSLPIRIQGTGTGTVQTVSVPNKPYTFKADTYAVLGGTDASPSPVVYSLASLGACTQVTGSVVAKDHNVRVGQWHVDVEGLLPTAVLVQGQEGNPNWERVTVTTRVQTDIAGGQAAPAFQTFVSEVERRCPITQLFKRSGVEVVTAWENEPLE